jgi:hypothetical protein
MERAIALDKTRCIKIASLNSVVRLFSKRGQKYSTQSLNIFQYLLSIIERSGPFQHINVVAEPE